jgi:hypothetical protein
LNLGKEEPKKERKQSLILERKSHSSQDAFDENEIENRKNEFEEEDQEDIMDRLNQFSSNLGVIIEKDIKQQQ